jgi:predicted transcriptional regulator
VKTRQISVGVKTLKEGLTDFSRAVRQAQSGPIPRFPKARVYFVSLEAMVRVLTPKRLALLHTIRDRRPHSVYELSRMADRDLKNVQEDVRLLSQAGLIDINRTPHHRKQATPHVDYDNLQLQIQVA